MTDEPDVILGLINGKSSVQMFSGFYRGLDGLRALVDFSGGRVPAYVATGSLPLVNDPVWVMVLDGSVAFMLGSTIPQPGKGTVVSAGTGEAVLDTVIGPVSARYDGTILLPVPGDEVWLSWNEGCWINGITVHADGPTAPPAPGGGGGRQTVTFYAIDSGSYQAGYGWRTTEVWSSSSNRGAWFYGTQIKDTIPDSAGIVSAEIFLPNPGQQIGARPFGRHAYASKPGGAPTISATSTLSGTSGWVPIPTSLLDDLKVNGGGFGFDLGGWWTWPGGGQSGAVRVTYDA